MRKTSTNMMLKLVIGLLMSVFYLHVEVMSEVPSPGDTIHKTDECDLFSGEWRPSTLAPSYANRGCQFLSDRYKCVENGRPDSGYLFWRWKPHNCNLPPFHTKKFLNAMRDKSLAMIGDSVVRNQMQSLVCLLSEEEQSAQTHNGNDGKSMRWHSSSYNFTITLYWAPFLLKAHSVAKRKTNVYLDALEDTWTTQYNKHNYIVIAAGAWFSTPTILMKNNTVVGCHSCKGEYNEVGPFYAYRRALQMAFNFILTSDHKPHVVFRTWSPEHFEYGKWYNGGFCNRTSLYHEGEYNDTNTGHKSYAIDMDEYSKAFAIGSEKGISMKLLDIYHLSLLRPDGHPGPYMKYHPFDKSKSAKVQNDCLHWCLPGPIDTWNILMMEMILKRGDTHLRDA